MIYNILVVFAVIVAVVFIMLIFVTGKGDAMSSGGGSIRTTFKGKASIDEQIQVVALALGGIFVALMLLLDFVGQRTFGR